jgi:hypothetical protein
MLKHRSWAERKRCAWPADLNCFICRSRRRVGWCEFSALLFNPLCWRNGFHRIRHYGLLANANRADNIALARQLLGVPDPAPASADSDRADGGHEDEEPNICPCCGARMVIVETFQPGCQPRLSPSPAIGFDSS